MIFRSAAPADLEDVFRLMQRAIRAQEREGIFQWDEFYPTRDDLAEDIRRGEMTIGEAEGRPALIYTLNQNCEDEYFDAQWLDRTGKFLVLHRLCVAPESQHRGHAREALGHIEDVCRARGVASIRLDVFRENPRAEAMYMAWGCRKTGEALWRKGRFDLMEKIL